MEAKDRKLIYPNPAKLVGYGRNSRTHSDAQIRAIRASIDRFGPTNPILLKDDRTTIGAGHARQLACLLDPPITRFPAIVLGGLTDEEWRAYVIADNKLAETGSGWDQEMLRLEMTDLKAADFDMDLTGFTSREMAALLGPGQGNTDPDLTPDAPAVPTSSTGDVWIMGKHRLCCGDSTSADSLAAATDGAQLDLLLTDPPYGIGFEYAGHNDTSNEANARLVQAVFDLAPKAKVWTPGLMNLARDIARFGAAKVLCWHKGFAQAGNGLGGASTWEPVLVVGPPKRKSLSNDYLDFKTDRELLAGRSLREFHPCPKPAALFAHLAEAFCPPKGIIYEPFSGSGTTIIAAEMTGRSCIAMELTPAYVDVAVQRWQAFTGKDATLASTGRTYAETTEERSKPRAKASQPRAKASRPRKSDTSPAPPVTAQAEPA